MHKIGQLGKAGESTTSDILICVYLVSQGKVKEFWNLITACCMHDFTLMTGAVGLYSYVNYFYSSYSMLYPAFISA